MGAVTAACSFFATAFTDFRGVAQLGVIAGGGIMLCWLAAMTVLPAMIMLFDEHNFGRKPPAALDIYSGLRPLYAKPRLTLLATAAAVAVLATGASKVWYDDNLLNLQPVGLESVELERKLLTETNESSWFALSVAKDAADALRLKAAFSNPKLKSVERVEELAEVLPTQEDQVRPVIERLHSRLAGLPARAPAIPSPSPAELFRVLSVMAQGATVGPQAGRAAAMAPLGQLLRSLPPQELCRRAGRLPATRRRRSARPAGPAARRRRSRRPTLADLPESLVCRFIGRTASSC